jgi:hypothetical protein
MHSLSSVSSLRRFLWTVVLTLVCAGPALAVEEKHIQFDVLEVGAETYSNVTVTMRSPRSVFLVHSRGMESVNLTNLSGEALVKLGYRDPRVPATNAAVAWVRSHVPAAKMPTLEQVRQFAPPMLESRLPQDLSLRQVLSIKVLSIAGAIALALHLLFSFLLALICKNAEAQASPLIWIPIVQLVPLFQAAQMSAWWVLGLFVPLFNLVVMVLWSFKIVRACGKGTGLAVLLLIPVLNVLAFLYLALSRPSGNKSEKPVSQKIQIITMEAV